MEKFVLVLRYREKAQKRCIQQRREMMLPYQREFQINQQLIVMTSQELNSRFSSNLPHEKFVSVQSNTNPLVSEQYYKDLLASIFEVNQLQGTHSSFFPFSPISSIQYCQQLSLSSKTAYLAKIYFDIILQKTNCTEASEILKFSLCCIWIAIKSNEPESISQYFDAHTICEHSQNCFTSDDLIATETYICQLLLSPMTYDTPYDYIQPFFQSFPWYTNAKVVIQSLIELSGSILSLRNVGPKEIFYGSFTAVCQLKNLRLKPGQMSILRQQMKGQMRVEAISDQIIKNYYQILLDDVEDEDLKRNQAQMEQNFN